MVAVEVVVEARGRSRCSLVLVLVLVSSSRLLSIERVGIILSGSVSKVVVHVIIGLILGSEVSKELGRDLVGSSSVLLILISLRRLEFLKMYAGVPLLVLNWGANELIDVGVDQFDLGDNDESRLVQDMQNFLIFTFFGVGHFVA